MGESTNPRSKLRFDRRIRLEFHGATITSDAGLLACRELDDALGLTKTASECLQESRGVGAVGRDRCWLNGAGGGLWLSLGVPMAVLGSGAGAGSAGQHAGEDNRGPGRSDSVGRLGSLVDGSGAVGAVRQAMAGLAIEPGRE